MFKLFKKDNTSPDVVEITIATKTVLRVVGLIFAIIVLLAAVKQASGPLIWIFTAFFLALALNAPVNAIARKLPGKLKGSRSLATTITFVVVVLFFAGFLASIVPPLVKQTESFVDNVPSLVAQARDQNSSVGHFISRYHLQDQLNSTSDQLTGYVKSASGSAVKTIGKIGTSIFAVLTILVLTFMMLVEGPRMLEFLREMVPKPHRAGVEKVALDMYRVIRGFINGQVLLAGLASLLISPALFILHISYPIALVVVIFVCGLIPMVGHTLGAIIVTIVALFTSLPAAIIILSYYILYQQIENYLVQPRIQANSTDLSPLLVFISVVVGVSFGGLFGGLFSIPIAGCIRILVLDFLTRHEYINRVDAPVIEDTAKRAEA